MNESVSSVFDHDGHERLNHGLSERAVVVLDARLLQPGKLLLGSLDAHLQFLVFLGLLLEISAQLLNHDVLLVELSLEKRDFSVKKLFLVQLFLEGRLSQGTLLGMHLLELIDLLAHCLPLDLQLLVVSELLLLHLEAHIFDFDILLVN